MVSVEEAAVDPGEIVEGLRAQVRPEGAEQVSVISPLNPPTAAALTMTSADAPGATVVLAAERFKENPGLPAAAAGVRLANTAVALPPAAEKLGWPALPPAVM